LLLLEISEWAIEVGPCRLSPVLELSSLQKARLGSPLESLLVIMKGKDGDEAVVEDIC
jgi:hypothetical protein